MAATIVPTPAQHGAPATHIGQPKVPSAKIEWDGDLILQGAPLVELFVRKLGARHFEALSDKELLSLYKIASNEQSAGHSGLRILGDLISGYDKEMGELDRVSAGWLVKHLAGQLEGFWNLEGTAAMELNQRGFDLLGEPVRGQP